MSTKTASSSRSFKNGNEDNDVDRFMAESCRSFRECNIKNNARRNSLQKKTLGIESERRLASASLSREERHLREQLKHMNIEKMKHSLVHNLREQKTTKKPRKKQSAEEHALIPTEPYPVTFRSQTPSPVDLDARERRLYLLHHGRRQSKEFEDLSLSTKSGKLLHNNELEHQDEDEVPRRRVFSMSNAVKPRFRSNLLRVESGSCTPSPRTSPAARRKAGTHRGGASPKKGQNSSGSSKESLEDVDKINSLDDLHWVGEPEAIHSVRRARRTVDEQELETEIYKLKKS